MFHRTHNNGYCYRLANHFHFPLIYLLFFVHFGRGRYGFIGHCASTALASELIAIRMNGIILFDL